MRILQEWQRWTRPIQAAQPMMSKMTQAKQDDTQAEENITVL